MTKDELLAKYDPANAANLTESDLIEMQALTDEQITELAKAYPNVPARKAYLILYDKNVDKNKQLYALSTWQNLNNVRKYANRKNLVPYTFKSLFDTMRNPAAAARLNQQRNTGPAKKVTVDLTAQQAAAELDAALQKRPVTTSANKQVNTAPVTSTPAAPAKAASAKKAGTKTASKTTTKAAATQVENTAAANKAGNPADQEFTSGTDDVK